MKKETRVYTAELTEMRAVKDEDGNRFIEGFGAVFNHESRLIMDWDGEYKEVIRTGAFDEVLESKDLDVLVTYNHDKTRILGRYTAGRENNSLELRVEEKGLFYRVSVPNTSTGDEVYTLVQRGDITESSFAFSLRAEDQEWDMNGDINIRYVNKVAGLYDVSPVWKGAYSETDTETAKRHFKEAEEAKKEEENKPVEANGEELKAAQDVDEMSLRLLKLKGDS